jgi:hypothetical protein
VNYLSVCNTVLDGSSGDGISGGYVSFGVYFSL